MQVDRKKFLLALGLSTSAAGCIVQTVPPPSGPTTVDNRTAPPTGEGGDVYAPSGEAFCVGKTFEPTEECVAWSEGTELPGYMPTDECIDWAPPADEMTPTYECITWMYEPSSEA